MDLKYEYEHLGANANAVDEILAGKTSFAQVFKKFFLGNLGQIVISKM